jgi:hypothetical protein
MWILHLQSNFFPAKFFFCIFGGEKIALQRRLFVKLWAGQDGGNRRSHHCNPMENIGK